MPMRSVLLASTICLAAVLPVNAEAPVAAKLVGHVILPAETFIDPPADAPTEARISGKFTQSGKRADAIGSVAGKSAQSDRLTGLSVPFKGQPVQGFSGIKSLGNNEFLVLTDNGFGSKLNSPDALLMFHRIKADWATGKFERLSTAFLRDPDRKAPFRITHEASAERYLTGSDFDLESIQPVGDKFWIGDEFGPYLLRVDATGKVEAVFETEVEGKLVKSADHYTVVAPAQPALTAEFQLRRSRGYEGMAASPDGRFLYPLLEGPLWDAAAKAYEMDGGKEYLRILEFNAAEGKWTGRSWRYPLEANGHAIGDFNMIDATTALVIERDNGEGMPAQACPEGQKAATCFENPAKFKRVFKIEMNDANASKEVRKIASIDLMAIADPDGNARQGRREDGTFAFPFFTIEDVDVVNRERGLIIVGNDNNLPFSAGRALSKADDNEFILLEAKALLDAK
jgi:hypothetical protein